MPSWPDQHPPVLTPPTPSPTLQALLDSSSDGMFSLDRAYGYIAFNRAHARRMAAMFGAQIQLGQNLLGYVMDGQERERVKQNFDRALAGEEFTLRTFYGAEKNRMFDLDMRYCPMYAADGSVTGVHILSRDVGDLKRAEEDLQRSENLFGTLFLFSTIGTTLIGPNGHFMRANPAFCALLGYSETELAGMTFNDITLEADQQLGSDFLHEALDGRAETTRFEKRYRKKDGGLLWVDVSCAVLRDAAGNFQYLLTNVRDISQAKQDQEALLDQQARQDALVRERTRQLTSSEAMYRSLFDHISSIIVIFDPNNGQIQDANPAACEYFGYPHGSLVGLRMPDLVKISSDAMHSHAQQILSGQKIHMEAMLSKSSGEVRHLSVYPGVIDYQQGRSIMAVLHDVTEARQAEDKIRQSQQQLLKLASQVPGMLYQLKQAPDGTLTVPFTSDAIWDIFGCSPEAVLNDFSPIVNVILPDDMRAIQEAIEESARNLSPFQHEYRVQLPGQPVHWVGAQSLPEKLPDGSIVWSGFNTDITERKQIEDKLRQRSLAVDASPVSIVVTNINGDIEYVNPRFTALTGYSFEEARGENPRILQSGYTSQEEYRQLWDTLMAGQVWQGEFRNRKKNGEFYWENASISPILNESGQVTHYVAVKEDITERKENQQRILDALTFNQTILDASPIGIVIYDAVGKCISANQAAGWILGASAETLLNNNFHAIETWKTTGLYSAAQLAIETGKSVSTQAHFISTFGKEAWINATFVTFKMAAESHLLYMFADNSERQKIEEQLRRSNNKLEEMVGELENRNKDADLLRQMSDMLQACNSTQEAYQVIQLFGPQIFAETAGAIFMSMQGQLSFEAACVWGDNLASELVYKAHDCWALRRARLYKFSATDSGIKCAHIDKDFMGCYLDIPLILSNEIIGLLHVEWPRCAAPARSLVEMAQIMADHISLSLSNIKLRETLHNQSVRDPLTHTFNRRYMEETLERELPRAKRKGGHVGMLMLDIDHFKQFNDSHGHAAGDLILTRLSAQLQSHVRGEDIVCRMGGEEFLMILPDASLEVTRQRAEAVRAAVRAMIIEYNNSFLEPVSVSIGVAAYPEHGLNAKDVLHQADRALYLAKKNGRNRVEDASSLED